MGQSETHLAAWEAARLIDQATAERIRTWEQANQAATVSAPSGAPEGAGRGLAGIAAIFGPGIAIGEMFAYLGAIFLLAAFEVFVGRSAGASPNQYLVYAVGSAIQAMAMFALGLALRRGDARRGRAAGVAFFVAVVHSGIAVGFAAEAAGLDGRLAGVIGSLAALGVAMAARRLHPSLTTQAAILGSVTAVAWATFSWVEQTWFGYSSFEAETPVRNGPGPVALTVISAAWWLLSGLVIGWIGLVEARGIGRVPGAGARAGLSRLWAGLVAVTGFCLAVTRSDMLSNGEYGRVLEPWVAQVAILILAAILVERAFRRDAAAFIVPAAIALIVALTDFNFTYLAERTEVGLLIEGLILLGVGFGADRIRRRMGRGPTAGGGRKGPSETPIAAPVDPPIATRLDQPADAVVPGE
jgi:hypothetical protein